MLKGAPSWKKYTTAAGLIWSMPTPRYHKQTNDRVSKLLWYCTWPTSCILIKRHTSYFGSCCCNWSTIWWNVLGWYEGIFDQWSRTIHHYYALQFTLHNHHKLCPLILLCFSNWHLVWNLDWKLSSRCKCWNQIAVSSEIGARRGWKVFSVWLWELSTQNWATFGPGNWQ